MSRNWHTLRPNKANKRPTRHIFVDVETTLIPQENNTTLQTLRLGWCCYWRRETPPRKDTQTWYRFTQVEDFWDIVWSKLKPREPLYLIAHNVDFDFGILKLFDTMSTHEFELKSIYLSGTTDIIQFCKGKVTIYILDNGNFFPGKLEKLGRAIGFPKMDVDPLYASDAEIDPYCKRDVEIMLKAWEYFYTFLNNNNLGNWGKTLPSQAFNAYRHRFMSFPIMIHGDEEALELERKAYHGGRCSVFYKGILNSDTYYKLDVNSMYPFVMRNHKYPCKLWGVRKGMSIRRLELFLKSYLAIAQVVIETDIPSYSVTYKGHAVYPIGTFETTLCTPELMYALEHQHVKSVKKVAFYVGEYIFTEYVDFFYGLKTRYTKEDNQPYRSMTKLYLNSLYGKFGQKRHAWEPVDDPMLVKHKVDIYVNLKTGKRYHVHRFDGRVWICSDKGEAYNSFPAISAHVTAYARMYLLHLLSLCGRGNFYYCDTDSIITSSIGLENLSGSLGAYTLGNLKIEEISDHLDIRCPKCYQMGVKWRRKGIPQQAVYLGENTWEYDQFPSFRRQSKWASNTPYHTSKTRKHLSYRIHDGKETESGWINPVNSKELWPESVFPPETLERIAQCEMQKEALKEAKKVPHTVVFTLWNYRKGTWRQAKDSYGNIVPLEYSNWDSKATELGFNSLDELLEATMETLSIERQIAKLTREIHLLSTPQTDTSSPGPMPW